MSNAPPSPLGPPNNPSNPFSTSWNASTVTPDVPQTPPSVSEVGEGSDTALQASASTSFASPDQATAALKQDAVSIGSQTPPSVKNYSAVGADGKAVTISGQYDSNTGQYRYTDGSNNYTETTVDGKPTFQKVGDGGQPDGSTLTAQPAPESSTSQSDNKGNIEAPTKPSAPSDTVADDGSASTRQPVAQGDGGSSRDTQPLASQGDAAASDSANAQRQAANDAATANNAGQRSPVAQGDAAASDSANAQQQAANDAATANNASQRSPVAQGDSGAGDSAHAQQQAANDVATANNASTRSPVAQSDAATGDSAHAQRQAANDAATANNAGQRSPVAQGDSGAGDSANAQRQAANDATAASNASTRSPVAQGDSGAGDSANAQRQAANDATAASNASTRSPVAQGDSGAGDSANAQWQAANNAATANNASQRSPVAQGDSGAVANANAQRQAANDAANNASTRAPQSDAGVGGGSSQTAAGKGDVIASGNTGTRPPAQGDVGTPDGAGSTKLGTGGDSGSGNKPGADSSVATPGDKGVGGTSSGNKGTVKSDAGGSSQTSSGKSDVVTGATTGNAHQDGGQSDVVRSSATSDSVAKGDAAPAKNTNAGADASGATAKAGRGDAASTDQGGSNVVAVSGKEEVGAQRGGRDVGKDGADGKNTDNTGTPASNTAANAGRSGSNTAGQTGQAVDKGATASSDSASDSKTTSRSTVTDTKTGGDAKTTVTDTKTGGDTKTTVTDTKTGGDTKTTVTDTKTGGDTKTAVADTKTGGDANTTVADTKTGGDVKSTPTDARVGSYAKTAAADTKGVDGKTAISNVIEQPTKDSRGEKGDSKAKSDAADEKDGAKRNLAAQTAATVASAKTPGTGQIDATKGVSGKDTEAGHTSEQKDTHAAIHDDAQLGSKLQAQRAAELAGLSVEQRQQQLNVFGQQLREQMLQNMLSNRNSDQPLSQWQIMRQLGLALREFNQQNQLEGDKALNLRSLMKNNLEQSNNRQPESKLTFRPNAAQEAGLRSLVGSLQERQQLHHINLDIGQRIVAGKVVDAANSATTDRQTRIVNATIQNAQIIEEEVRAAKLKQHKGDDVAGPNPISDMKADDVETLTSTDPDEDDNGAQLNTSASLLSQPKDEEETEKVEPDKQNDEPKKVAEARRKYIIKYGDTLESIAQRQLRNAKFAPLIYDINKGTIPAKKKNKKLYLTLKPGSVLWLPAPTEMHDFESNPLGGFGPSFAYENENSYLDKEIGRMMSTDALNRVDVSDKMVHADSTTISQLPPDTSTEDSVSPTAELISAAAIADDADLRVLQLLGENKKRDDGKIHYVVRLGDSVRSIAIKHPALQDVTLWPLLVEVNNLDASKGSSVSLARGSTLLIPTPEEVAAYRQQVKKPNSGSAGLTGSFSFATKECPKCKRVTVPNALVCVGCGFRFVELKSTVKRTPAPGKVADTSDKLSASRTEDISEPNQQPEPRLENGGHDLDQAIVNDSSSAQTDSLMSDTAEAASESIEQFRKVLRGLSKHSGKPETSPKQPSAPAKRKISYGPKVPEDGDLTSVVLQVAGMVPKLKSDAVITKSTKGQLIKNRVTQLSDVVRVVNDRRTKHAADDVYKLRLEFKYQDKWTTIVEYEISPDVALRYEYHMSGQRRTIRIDLPPNAVLELVENDFTANWPSYCDNYVAGQRMSL